MLWGRISEYAPQSLFKTWYHEVLFGQSKRDDCLSRFELLGGGSLQIFNLTEEDGGMYSCLADNANDSVEARAELTIQVPPKFLKTPSNTYAHEATDIVFECEATGSPAPTIKWVKNGDAVVPSDYFRILKEQNLQVQGLVKTDEGYYQCLAENEVGNIQASAQLVILDPECEEFSAWGEPSDVKLCNSKLEDGENKAHKKPFDCFLSRSSLYTAGRYGHVAQEAPPHQCTLVPFLQIPLDCATIKPLTTFSCCPSGWYPVL
ncbi:neogenin 1a isoform X1 [Tachysurus ichikawai]